MARSHSLEYQFLLRARPDLRFDLEQLDEQVARLASLDTLAIELEVQGSGDALAIRTAALRQIGTDLLKLREVSDVLSLLAGIDAKLVVWAANACAKDAMSHVTNPDRRVLEAMETTDRWIAGEEAASTLKALSDAIDAAYASATEYIADAGVDPFAYVVVLATSSAYAYARDMDVEGMTNARSAVKGAITAAMRIRGRIGEYSTERETKRVLSLIGDSLVGFPVQRLLDR